MDAGLKNGLLSSIRKNLLPSKVLVMTALPGSAARAAFVGAACDRMTGTQKIISRAALGQRLPHADLP